MPLVPPLLPMPVVLPGNAHNLHQIYIHQLHVESVPLLSDRSLTAQLQTVRTLQSLLGRAVESFGSVVSSKPVQKKS